MKLILDSNVQQKTVYSHSSFDRFQDIRKNYSEEPQIKPQNG